MKVSKNWLKELVDLPAGRQGLKVSVDEVIRLLPLRTIGTKEITDKFIELDMKGYNRADLLSMRGVALEIAAITNSKVNFTDPENFIWNTQEYSKTKIEVEDEKAIPTYCIAKIENLKSGPSPKERKDKLEDAGMRSIDCLTDITNLIMLEYGQPMHAFDANMVKNETLIVRHAKADETLVTLDNKSRKLTTDDLVIADPEKILGLAGVMGGKNSEVTDTTTTILLEAAIFDPITIRKTASRLALPSEASKRFQHGLTSTRLQQAFDAAIKMYQNLGGKLTAISLQGTMLDQIKTIDLHQDTLNSLVGIDIPPSEVESSLQKLGFTLASQDSTLQSWEVKVPYFRLDIEIEADLIEEVARLHGYETIPAKLLEGEIPEKIDQTFFELIQKLKVDLVNIGLTEVQTYSYFSTQIIKNLKLNTANLVQVANPMSAETEFMRDQLWPNLLEVTAKNIRNGIYDIVIFEIGKVYSSGQEGPEENYHLSIALCNETDNPLQELYQIAKGLNLDLKNELTGTYFHPTRHTKGLAEIHPRIVNKFGMEKRVAILEIGI